MSKNDGGPAFPVSGFNKLSPAEANATISYSQWEHAPHGGMTVRQYYKAAIAPAVFRLPENIAELMKKEKLSAATIVARIAGEIADEMILEDQKHETR